MYFYLKVWYRSVETASKSEARSHCISILLCMPTLSLRSTLFLVSFASFFLFCLCQLPFKILCTYCDAYTHCYLRIGPINTYSCWQKTVFSWGPCRGIIRGHSQENRGRIEGVQRSSSVGSQNSSSGVSSRKKVTVCQTVICELL
jgi:hypothetical protein